MKNRTKIILTSAIIIAVCLALVTGSTFALFTNNDARMNVNIVAGEIKVEASVVDKGTNGVGKDDVDIGSTIMNGEERAKPFAEVTSFTSTSITVSTMVPGDYVEFEFVIKNEGSIAINYKVVMTTGGNSDLSGALNFSRVGMVNGNLDEFDNTTVFSLAANTSEVFKVRITLPVANNNNTYQGQSCDITYSIQAWQGNAASNQ